jgi:predicted ABC-type ATPase
LDNPEPLLVIYAGPNGSGKSTITEEDLLSRGFPDLYINADEIAKDQNIGIFDAAVEATERRREALDAGISFAMETVMSTPDKIEFMKEAKDKGYRVHLEYITTQDPEINLLRVNNRVLDGGHDVPQDKILSRYDRSMKLLPQAVEIADSATIYNNSFEDPIVIAEKTMGIGIVIYPRQPPSRWNEREILRLLGIKEAKVVFSPPSVP